MVAPPGGSSPGHPRQSSECQGPCWSRPGWQPLWLPGQCSGKTRPAVPTRLPELFEWLRGSASRGRGGQSMSTPHDQPLHSSSCTLMGICRCLECNVWVYPHLQGEGHTHEQEARGLGTFAASGGKTLHVEAIKCGVLLLSVGLILWYGKGGVVTFILAFFLRFGLQSCGSDNKILLVSASMADPGATRANS